MKVFIIGHKSPDLDAIASAVVYKDLLYAINRHLYAEFIAVRADEPNEETKYVFNRFDVDMPNNLNDYEISEGDQFILVDHNENRQIHDTVNLESVIEIIDHHKINLNTTQPVKVLTDPLGSTCSVIYDDAQKYQLKDWPTPSIKGLILAAIISDTQGLKSNTTTEKDRRIARQLSKELALKLEDITFEIFKAKSDISNDTTYSLVTKDVKTYDFADQKVFISQIETVEPGAVLNLESQLVTEMVKIKQARALDHMIVVVTDVLNIDSHALFSDDIDKNLCETAFEVKAEGNKTHIGSRLSRKKDIAPAIEKTLIEWQNP